MPFSVSVVPLCLKLCTKQFLIACWGHADHSSKIYRIAVNISTLYIGFLPASIFSKILKSSLRRYFFLIHAIMPSKSRWIWLVLFGGRYSTQKSCSSVNYSFYLCAEQFSRSKKILRPGVRPMYWSTPFSQPWNSPFVIHAFSLAP